MRKSEMTKLTEEYCADKFEDGLRSKKLFRELPDFGDNILREMPCKQGIADFICYKETAFLRNNQDDIFKLTELLGKTFVPVISSLLNRGVQSIDELSYSTGYPVSRLKRIVNVLKEKRVLKCNKAGAYSLYAKWKKFDVKLWAFELKLHNWQRAIYQASQHKTFTDKSYTVFPVDKRELILKNLESFKRANVGCIIHDYEANSIEVLFHPVGDKISWNSHYLFALSETVKMKRDLLGNRVA